jgi:hypothetical protein
MVTNKQQQISQRWVVDNTNSESPNPRTFPSSKGESRRLISTINIPTQPHLQLFLASHLSTVFQTDYTISGILICVMIGLQIPRPSCSGLDVRYEIFQGLGMTVTQAALPPRTRSRILSSDSNSG